MGLQMGNDVLDIDEILKHKTHPNNVHQKYKVR
jgi:hypothetical protein